MNHWYLMYTKPQQEKVALDNLTRQNYQCYLPLINKEKISQGKKILTKEPMFPRYLFVRLNNDGLQNWSPIRSTKGVVKLVSFGNVPAAINDEAINNLRQNIDKHLIFKAFLEGDIVEIVRGPFKGLEAVFKAYNGQERAILLLNFMAKHTNANIDLDKFKKIA
jgi:transcriptional antiterminator RfaH